MDYVYLMLLHKGETKQTGDYSVMIFMDAVSAHVTANWYNIYSDLHAEVFMIPVIESITVHPNKENIIFKFYKGGEASARN